MSGLLLGFIGGMMTGGAAIAGGLPVVFHDLTLEKSLKEKIEFITGALLFILTVGLCIPSKGFNHLTFLSLLLAAACGLFFTMLMKKVIRDGAKSALFFEHQREEQAFFILLFILFQNVIKGLAIGASMNINHPGVNYSLLVGMGINNLCEGMVMASCFLVLGLDGLFVSFGMLFFAGIEILSAAFGGYFAQEARFILPTIFAFASGALMSHYLENPVAEFWRENKTFKIRHNIMSGMMVMLLLAIWKEII